MPVASLTMLRQYPLPADDPPWQLYQTHYGGPCVWTAACPVCGEDCAWTQPVERAVCRPLCDCEQRGDASHE